jgi:hypothetical protein
MHSAGRKLAKGNHPGQTTACFVKARDLRHVLSGVLNACVSVSGRLACVVGDEGSGGVSREAAIFGFAPESSEAPANRHDDLYDVLVTTDVLSEGMNLQQCRNVVNYDLPWNPMRLVQRHGRIDRIGSPHKDVFMMCFFPDVRKSLRLGSIRDSGGGNVS